MKKKFLIVFFVCIVCSVPLWFFLFSKPYFSCLNIQISPYSIPTTQIKIEEKEYLVKIDLGSKFPLVLTQESLLNLRNKEKKEKVKWKNFKGNSFSANSYLLSKVKLGDITLSNILVHENNLEFRKSACFAGNSEEYPQNIGRPPFEKFKILLDCKNNKLFISNDLKKLKKEGYEISNFIRVPCQRGRTGLILEVETDLGKKRLSIDTGFTITSLRSSSEIKNIGKKYNLPFFTTKKFVIGDKNYGALDLFLLDITPELNELDGILGMDFIKNHVMYIDFPAKIVYIK